MEDEFKQREQKIDGGGIDGAQLEEPYNNAEALSTDILRNNRRTLDHNVESIDRYSADTTSDINEAIITNDRARNAELHGTDSINEPRHDEQNDN